MQQKRIRNDVNVTFCWKKCCFKSVFTSDNTQYVVAGTVLSYDNQMNLAYAAETDRETGASNEREIRLLSIAVIRATGYINH